jgi:hypothetical protein
VVESRLDLVVGLERLDEAEEHRVVAARIEGGFVNI